MIHRNRTRKSGFIEVALSSVAICTVLAIWSGREAKGSRELLAITAAFAVYAAC
jgi:hypothetical protein